MIEREREEEEEEEEKKMKRKRSEYEEDKETPTSPPKKKRKTVPSPETYVKGNSTLVDVLPNHILQLVFDYLTNKEVRRVSTVCKQFMYQLKFRRDDDESIATSYVKKFRLYLNQCFECYLESSSMYLNQQCLDMGIKKYNKYLVKTFDFPLPTIVFPRTFFQSTHCIYEKHRMECGYCGKLKCPKNLIECSRCAFLSEGNPLKNEGIMVCQMVCRNYTCVRHCYFCKKTFCKSCCRTPGPNEQLRRCSNKLCKKLICRNCHLCKCGKFISKTLCQFCYQFDKCIQCGHRKKVKPKKGWIPRQIRKRKRKKKTENKKIIYDLTKENESLKKEIDDLKKKKKKKVVWKEPQYVSNVQYKFVDGPEVDGGHD